MKNCVRGLRRGAGIAAAFVLCLLGHAGQVSAQDDPNPGALTFTGGVDVPSVYVFRGLVQESDPKITLWPYGDLGIALKSGDGTVKSVGVNVGVWNSLHTGSAGSNGPTAHAHYEEDFYTMLNLGFGGGTGVGIGYMALTSPNLLFPTIKELQVKVTKSHRLNPYGFLTMELTDSSADGGAKKGTYLELGASPVIRSTPKLSLAIPVKVGLSLKDYYENIYGDGDDHKFGWFDVGGLVTVPLGVPARFGLWNVHGGVDLLLFGDTGKSWNDGNSTKVVGLFGVGVGY